jgi:hypothetical protein
MKNINIHYFGSLADGFKIYPYSTNYHNKFSPYYDNSETDWLLHINNSNQSVFYTFVKYGILTSLEKGRAGSCLGIVMEFSNSYFSDFEVFRTSIIEKVLEIFLQEKRLLSQYPNSDSIAFSAYNLSEVSSYLDNMTVRINEFIYDKFSNYIIPSNRVKIPDNSSFLGLNSECPNAVIKEMFELTGSIRLSPKYPLEIKTLAEKEEDRKILIQKNYEDEIAIEKAKNQEWKKLYSLKEGEVSKLTKDITILKTEIQTLKNNKKNEKNASKSNNPEKEENRIKNQNLQISASVEVVNHDLDKGNPLEKNPNNIDEKHKSGTPINQGNVKKPLYLGLIIIFSMFIIFKIASCEDTEPLNNTDTAKETVNTETQNVSNNKKECEFDVSENFQEWNYKGKALKKTIELAIFVANNCGKKNCTNWIEELKKSIESNNPSDIRDGSIEQGSKIFFKLPSNVTFDKKDGFTRK